VLYGKKINLLLWCLLRYGSITILLHLIKKFAIYSTLLISLLISELDLLTKLSYEINFNFKLFKVYFFIIINGDWGLGIGDWGLGGWAQAPAPQTPTPNPRPRN